MTQYYISLLRQLLAPPAPPEQSARGPDPRIMQELQERAANTERLIRGLGEAGSETTAAVVSQVVGSMGLPLVLRRTRSNTRLLEFLLTVLPTEVVQQLEQLPLNEITDLIAAISPEVFDQLAQGLSNPLLQTRFAYARCVLTVPSIIRDYGPGGYIPNPFYFLGVPRDADSDTIRRSYRLLLLASAPDRLTMEGQEELDWGVRRTNQINQAYALLSEANRSQLLGRLSRTAELYPEEPWFRLLDRLWPEPRP